MAEPATREDIQRALYSARAQGMERSIPSCVSRLLRSCGVDTVAQNGIRDHAQWAWIPGGGETCAFCLALASQGWVNASKKVLKGNHPDHIHDHCDCTFAIRFDDSMDVEGYDPDEILERLDNAEGSSWKDKINSIRREQYKINGDKIRMQKREAYAERERQKIGAPSTEELRVSAQKMENINGNWGVIANRIAEGEYSLKYKHQKYLQHVEGTIQSSSKGTR